MQTNLVRKVVDKVRKLYIDSGVILPNKLPEELPAEIRETVGDSGVQDLAEMSDEAITNPYPEHMIWAYSRVAILDVQRVLASDSAPDSRNERLGDILESVLEFGCSISPALFTRGYTWNSRNMRVAPYRILINDLYAPFKTAFEPSEEGADGEQLREKLVEYATELLEHQPTYGSSRTSLEPAFLMLQLAMRSCADSPAWERLNDLSWIMLPRDAQAIGYSLAHLEFIIRDRGDRFQGLCEVLDEWHQGRQR